MYNGLRLIEYRFLWLACILLDELLMKVAIPVWVDRISPVFDVARRLLIMEIENGVEISREKMALNEMALAPRAIYIVELGVQVLICGAISWPLEMALSSSGIQVIPHICGNVDEVLKAFLAGRLINDGFLMPGCCGRRRRFRGRVPRMQSRFDLQGDNQ